MGTIPPFNSQSDFRVVQLDHNDLTGSIPPTLYANRQLEKIDLSYNQLTGAIGNQIVAATKLTHLALEHNQLKESIPTQMGELFNLRYITLDHNQLSGSIPVALGNLWDCETLNLSENRLSGTIPEELGNMNSLQFLFLHSNLDLLGSIPASLATKKEPLLEFQVYNTTFSDGLENSFCLQPVFPNITADCQGESPQIRCSCCSLCFDAQDHLENSTKL